PEVVHRGAEADQIVPDEVLGEVGDDEGGSRDGQLGGQRNVGRAARGPLDPVADDLARPAHQQRQVLDDAEAHAAFGEDVVAEDVAVAGRVGQLVGGVVGGDEAVLVEDHHRVPADGVDLLGGEDLTAPAGEEAPLVEGEADQATGLRVVDDVPDLGDVLPAADGHHRQAVDLGGGHQELHGLPRVAITPPDRRRRWTTMNATTATTRTTSTTMSHPRASMRLFFPGWAPAAAVTARAAPRPAAAAEPTPIPRPPPTGRRHVPARGVVGSHPIAHVAGTGA